MRRSQSTSPNAANIRLLVTFSIALSLFQIYWSWSSTGTSSDEFDIVRFEEENFQENLPKVLRLGSPTFNLNYPYNSETLKFENYLMPSPKFIKFQRNFRTLELKPKVGIDVFRERWKFNTISKALERFFKRLNSLTRAEFRTEGKSPERAPLLSISCEEEIELPHLGMNESYSLQIVSNTIDLKAKTTVGILRGLETLLQLVIVKHKQNKIFLPFVEIEDEPKYQWRGLLLDISRRFFNKSEICIHLDAMAALKMNVLHLHLTDDQGFRMEVRKWPRFHRIGGQGGYLTHQDIREIVSFAKDRGIRVVPELDLPGHSASWIAAYNEMAPKALRNITKPDPTYGILPYVLNIFSNKTYEYIADVFTEVSEVFPDHYVHIGGDEVKSNSWFSDESIAKEAKERKMAMPNEIQFYFTQKLVKILERLNKKTIGWQEILNPQLPKNTILQGWHGVGPELISESEFAMVYSRDYYLDWIHAPCRYWGKRMFNGTNVIGGEGCA